jgi:tetratricopeptide (TPR) repeat protein
MERNAACGARARCSDRAAFHTYMPAQAEIIRLIVSAQQAADRHDWAEASRCWQEVQSTSPDYAPAYLGIGNAFREAARLEDAECAFAAGVARFADNEPLTIAWASLANLRRDWPAALDRWSLARTRFPINPWCYLGSINALRGAGHSDPLESLAAEAKTALAEAKVRGLDVAAALRVELEIAKALLEWEAVKRCSERIIAREAHPSANILLSLAQACFRLEDPVGADSAAERALSADPSLTGAWIVRLQVATQKGDGETALKCYRALVELNPGVVRWRLKLAQLLSWLGRVKESLAELDRVRAQWPNDPMVKVFLRNYGSEGEGNQASAIAPNGRAEHDPDFAKEKDLEAIAGQAPDAALRLRPLLVPDAERDVLIAEMPGAEAAVFVFTGTNDEVSMPLELFDRYLSTLPFTAIYLKDFKRLRFLQGIESLGADLPTTLEALQSKLARLGVKRLCTLGNCVGGFAAIRYGVELEADRIVAFSPPTCSPVETPIKLEEGRRFMKARLEANVSRDLTDLQPFLSGRRQSAWIELFYEDPDPRDRAAAQRLLGLPGVHLRPQMELSYRLLRRLAASNPDFLRLLGDSLAVSQGNKG